MQIYCRTVLDPAPYWIHPTLDKGWTTAGRMRVGPWPGRMRVGPRPGRMRVGPWLGRMRVGPRPGRMIHWPLTGILVLVRTVRLTRITMEGNATETSSSARPVHIHTITWLRNQLYHWSWTEQSLKDQRFGVWHKRLQTGPGCPVPCLCWSFIWKQHAHNFCVWHSDWTHFIRLSQLVNRNTKCVRTLEELWTTTGQVLTAQSESFKHVPLYLTNRQDDQLWLWGGWAAPSTLTIRPAVVSLGTGSTRKS